MINANKAIQKTIKNSRRSVLKQIKLAIKNGMYYTTVHKDDLSTETRAYLIKLGYTIMAEPNLDSFKIISWIP